MQTLEEQVRQLQGDVAKMPKNVTLEQATRIDSMQSVLNAIPKYKDNSLQRFAKGAIAGLEGLADIGPSLQIYGKQVDLALGGYFGAKPEQIERKALNLATSYRNLQAAQQERYKYSNPKDTESFAYGLGQGAFNYGLMLVGGGAVGIGAKAVGAKVATEIGAKTAAGLTANALLENVEQQSERMPLNENNEVDIKQITPEWARKSAAGTTAYLGVSTILEKGFGFGKQVKMWETPVKTSNRAIKVSSPVVKMAGKTALSEGATEGLQSLSSTGILLVEGKIDTSQLPDRLKDAWKEAVIGGILGGASGTAVSINQAHNVKTMLNDEISKVVTDPEECEKVVDAIYESGTIEMTNVISKELELSSELNTKHGAIYDNMQGAIFDAINNAGAFQGVEEAELAQYVSETSKMFANQVLAEANKRGVLIDEVLTAGDIKFENGKIQLKSGGKVIAETPVMQEPEAVTPTEQTQAAESIKINQEISYEDTPKYKAKEKQYKSYEKQKKAAAYEILSIATGKSAKWLRMQLGSDSNKRGMAKRREFIENLIAEYASDNITAGNGFDASWRDFFTDTGVSYDNQEVDGESRLIEQAFDAIINDAFVDPEYIIDKEMYERGQYFGKLYEDITEKFDNAKTLEELGEVWDNEVETLSKRTKEEIENALADYYEKAIERILNGQTGLQNEAKTEDARNRQSTSRTDVRTEEESNGNSISNLGNGSEISENEINLPPDDEIPFFQTKFYQEANKLYQEKDITETEAFKKWSDNAPLVTSEEALSYDFKTGEKVVVEAFHGTKRGDRVGSVFLPERATSGPMAFFSSDRGISENYAKGKEDTSLSEDMGDYDQWFKIKIDGRSIPLKDAWWNLTSQKRQEISEKAPHITLDEEANNVIYDENETRGIGNYDYEIKRYRGNALRTLVEGWLMGGTLYGREDDFIKVLELAGINKEDIDYIDPYTDHSKVYDVYISMKNPLVTTDIPKKVITKLKKVAKQQPKIEFSYGVDTWDKNTKDADFWINELVEDYNKGENSYAWTSIPDWVTDVLKSFGYDGIIDMGGKSGGQIHKVYIPFASNQIKSVDNQGTFDINDPNIYHQLKNNPKEPKKYRGAFDVSAKAIELFKDADYSTLPHELAHFWLDNMWQFSRSGKASEAYMNNFNGVLDWLGVKDGQINLTRAQQEKFARGYEKYLYNGYAPSGLVQGAFDDYDRWLQKVYKDAKELRVKLNADAIEFFDTMTTGELPEYDVPETQAEIREKNIEQINKDIETARKFVVEKQEQYNNYDGGNVITENTVPVTTEGAKKQSRAYTNQAAILGIAEELDYNRANIEEQNRLATEFVKNNLDEARQVVNGQKEAPSNILKNAIYNAYLKEMLTIGDNEAYINALRNQSLELTRAGQEIASQRGAIENIFDSGYWIRRIENLKKSKLASEKFGSGWTASEQEQALSRMNNYIKNKVDAVMEDFMAAKPEEQKKIAEKLSNEIAAEFKQKPDTTLYQSMREPSELRTRTNAYNYLYRYINGALGLELTRAQSNEIIAKTQAIQKSIETTRNRNGNPSALFFKNISEMETYANSIEPSPALAILTSTVGRGNMLFSPKTIALNIESNIVNFFTEAITRRLQTGAVEMSVDPQVIKDYLAYSRGVFNTSGYQVSSMPTLDPTTQILSEKMTTTGGNRLVDKVGRFFEQSIFKYGLGAPDLFFKDMTFVDTANLLATKEANGDSKKATELFKDICLIEPKTAKGRELREIAINEALVATYQNQGKTSDLALGIRNAINKATGSLRAGDLLSPFVKTPANVIGLGFDYSMGGLAALKNIQTIYNDIQNGTFTDITRKSLRSFARNGIGFFAAMLIAGMLDEDDYIPEYALLSPKERELVKLRGGVFNSIKIGNKYISLDYFGPLAMPLVSYLNARRADNAKDAIWNYFQGSAYQALKLPVVGDIKSLLEGTGRTLTQDADSNIKMAEDAMIDFVASRSIPAIVTDIAKMADEFERETNNNAMNRLISKLPVLREELPMQYNYGTGSARETQNPINILLAGARVKDEVTSPVIRELNRLDKTNAEEKVNLAKVTKSGKLSELSDTQKIDVERKFAQRYATEVNNLIQSNYYPTLDNSGKVKAINKIRDKVRDDIKIEYGLKQPPKPKRRYRRKR